MTSYSDLTEGQIQAALRYFANLPQQFRHEVLNKQTDLNRKLRGKQKTTAEFYEKTLALASFSMQNFEKSQQRRSKMTTADAKRLSELRRARVLKTQARGNKKARIIEKKYFHLIGELKKDGLSWREISQYLKNYHKFGVSHGYLQKTYNKLIAR